MLFRVLIILVICCLGFNFHLGGQSPTIYISELLTSNDFSITDEYGELEDWIEIHNHGSEVVDLKGMFLSDDENDPYKFEIQETILISPDDYILLWADGTPSQGVNHLNFKLSNGESLVFSSVDGIIDLISIENQRHNVSYGRDNYEGEFVYYKLPTPNKPNRTPSFKFLAQVKMDQSSGYYDKAISVTLSSDVGDIFYTLDGSVPTNQSLLYDNTPIAIIENTTLRAITYKEGYLTPLASTKTYVFDSPSTIPILFVTSNGDSINGHKETTIHTELIDKNEELLFSEYVTSQHHGSIEQGSFRITLGPKHGGNKVNYPIFNSKPFVNDFKSLIFRQAGNDGLNTSNFNRSHLRDGYVSSIVNQGGFNFKASGFRQVNVYLDGEYYGIYNMRERIDDSFLENNYDVSDQEPKCFIEYKFGEPNNVNVIEGEWSYFQDKLWSLCLDADLSNQTEFDQVANAIDLKDFTDFWIHEVYIGNYDWLSNNMYFWSPVNRYGKFRWIIWDTDVSLGLNGDPSWNSLAWATSTEDGRPMEGRRTAIIRALLTNESYRSFFITRFCDLINSEYLPENMIRILNDLSSNIKSEISRHTEKWGRGCLESWMNELEVIKEYVSLRTENVRHHIRSQFESLDSMSTISIDSSIPNACNFELNTIVLNDTSFPWAGIYFNGLPITISVIENPGFKFIGWENTNITDASIAFNLQNDTSLVAIFESTFDPDVDIVINEISYAQSDAFDSGDWIELFNNTNEAVDLSGWILHDGSNNDPFVFPSSTVLDASDYLVIVKDEVKFESVYPNVNNLIGEIDFGLSKQGDLIELFDNDLFLIDVVDYKTESPWPSSEGANSISLMDPKLNNNIGESWISSLTLRGTPGIQNDIINDISNQTLFSQSPLTLFPNPSNNLINIVPNAKGTIYIYNQIGLLVASFNNDGSSLNLDISKYQSGNYFVVFVTSDGLRYTSLFIKE